MLKQYRSHVLVNVTVVVLLLYLILAVEQLRNVKCAGLLSQQTRQQPVDPAVPRADPPLPQEPKPKSAEEVAPPPQAIEEAASPPKTVEEAAPPPKTLQENVPSPPATVRRKGPQPACAANGKRARTFLMVFSGHSGSTAIMSELRGHSEVIIERYEPVDHQEVFNTTEALEIARDKFDRGIADGKVPGFKIRPAHIGAAPDKWRALAKEYDTRIIWQYRKNIFKASVGEYTNRYLNDSSSTEGFMQEVSEEERCKIGAGCKFRVENMNFLNKLLLGGTQSQRHITSAVKAITGGSGCILELSYEDYLYEREASMKDLQEFLGLQWEDTKPGRFKATKDSLCELVENWEELCDQFYGCLEWQHQMDDPRNGCFCSLSATESKHCRTDQE